jgi:hypothetical protein
VAASLMYPSMRQRNAAIDDGTADLLRRYDQLDPRNQSDDTNDDDKSGEDDDDGELTEDELGES